MDYEEHIFNLTYKQWQHLRKWYIKDSHSPPVCMQTRKTSEALPWSVRLHETRWRLRRLCTFLAMKSTQMSVIWVQSDRSRLSRCRQLRTIFITLSLLTLAICDTSSTRRCDSFNTNVHGHLRIQICIVYYIIMQTETCRHFIIIIIYSMSLFNYSMYLFYFFIWFLT